MTNLKQMEPAHDIWLIVWAWIRKGSKNRSGDLGPLVRAHYIINHTAVLRYVMSDLQVMADTVSSRS